MKRLYTGPFSSVYREVWVERARHMRTDEWLWLLPTRYLLHTVRQKLLQGQAGIVDVPLFTFDDIAVRLVKHVDRNTQFLSPYAREKLIEKLLERHAHEAWLDVFRPIMDQPGLYRSIAHTIGEMKRSGLTEKEVEAYLRDSRADDVSGRRQQALARLFLHYQEELRRDKKLLRVDPEEMLRLACDLLENKQNPVDLPFASIHTLWADHFTDFTPLQMRLLRALVKRSDNVGIYIPFLSVNADQLPQLTKQLEETRRSLQQLGLEHVDLFQHSDTLAWQQLNNDWLSRQLPLSSLEPTLLHQPRREEQGTASTLTEAPEGLECLPACTPKREVEAVAKEIKRLVLLEGIDPKHIAIIVKDERYEQLLHEVMQRDGIPLDAHEYRSVYETALVRQLVSILQLAVADWERHDVLCLAEGGYIHWQDPPPYGLETWVKKAGIERGRIKWRQSCGQEIARLELSEREVEKAVMEQSERDRLLEQLKRQKKNVQRIFNWLDEVELLASEWAAGASWVERIETIRAIWDKLDVERCIKQLWSNDLKRGHVQGYCRDLDTYRAVYDTLNELKQMEGLMPERSRLSQHAFVRELRNLLKQKRVVVNRAQTGGVRVLNPSGARGASFDAVFVLGLNEGSFPSHHPEDWLIRDAERIAFHRGQARLPASYAHNEMEQLFFEMAVRTARHHLILSYISPEANEQVLRSRFLEQLEHTYAPGSWLAPERFAEAMESRLFARDGANLTSAQEYRNWFMAAWAGGEAQLEDHHLADQQLNLNRLIEHAKIEKERRKSTFGRWDGHLLDPNIHERLQQQFSADRSYSVSWLNDYAACPLHFFFSRVLGVQPLEETEQTLSPLDTGNVLHEVLRKLFVSRTNSYMCDRSLEEWLTILHTEFQTVVTQWEEERTHVLSPLWQLEKGRLYRMLQGWLQHEYVRQGRRRFKARHLEFSFGLPLGDRVDSDSVEQPIVLSLADETVRLVGRIDRIDFDENGHFVLYDYKLSTSRYEGCHNMEETTNFQLPLYILAYRQWLEEQGRPGKPVGAGFYGLRSQDKYKKIGIWEKSSLHDLGLGRTRSGVTEDVVEEAATVLERVSNMLDGIRHGRFYMLPEHEPNPYYGDQAVYRNS